MKRSLWATLVNGSPFAVFWWACFAAYQAFGSSSPVPVRLVVGSAYAILFLLNLASWDYQRRHRSGGVR